MKSREVFPSKLSDCRSFIEDLVQALRIAKDATSKMIKGFQLERLSKS